MKIIILLPLILSACSVDKCNDYYMAYECVEQHGTQCRQHYIEMCETCEEK